MTPGRFHDWRGVAIVSEAPGAFKLNPFIFNTVRNGAHQEILSVQENLCFAKTPWTDAVSGEWLLNPSARVNGGLGTGGMRLISGKLYDNRRIIGCAGVA